MAQRAASLPRRVNNLGLDKGMRRIEPDGAMSGDLHHLRGAVAIGVVQMRGDVGIEGEGGAQSLSASFGVEIPRPRQRQIGGVATASLAARPKSRDRMIDGVFGHLAVGGPFAAADGDEAAGADLDDIVARKMRGVGGLRVGDQRAQARPDREDVLLGHVEVEIAPRDAAADKRSPRASAADGPQLQPDRRWRRSARAPARAERTARGHRRCAGSSSRLRPGRNFCRRRYGRRSWRR